MNQKAPNALQNALITTLYANRPQHSATHSVLSRTPPEPCDKPLRLTSTLSVRLRAPSRSVARRYNRFDARAKEELGPIDGVECVLPLQRKAGPSGEGPMLLVLLVFPTRLQMCSVALPKEETEGEDVRDFVPFGIRLSEYPKFPTISIALKHAPSLFGEW